MRAVTGRPSLAALAWQIGLDANRTLGGGMASIELIRRSFEKRGWLDETGHALLVAVSRFTPGTNLLAYCVGLGWLVHRGAGAALALAGASIPGAVIVTVFSALVARLVAWPMVRAGLAAATLVAAVLVLSSAWALMRPHVFGARRVWALSFAVLAAAIFVSGVSPIRVLLIAAVLGALSPPREDRS
jgi:chromate transporter